MAHTTAQIPLSERVVEQLGEDNARDYAVALWEAAQHRDADVEEMAELIRAANARFDVEFPDVVVDKLQEIFRNSGGLVTIISNDTVLAGDESATGAAELAESVVDERPAAT